MANRITLAKATEMGLKVVKDYISDAGSCDHHVNICVCDLVQTAEYMEAALKAMKRKARKAPAKT